MSYVSVIQLVAQRGNVLISLYMENLNSHLGNINLQPNNEEFSPWAEVRG
jgi:hypothetical protein